MGLRANIYRGKYGGRDELADYDEVTIVNIEGPSKPTKDAPPVLLVHGNVPNSVKIVMAEQRPTGTYREYRPADRLGPMGNGAYVGTSDARLAEAIERITGTRFAEGIAPLHDRFETQEQYDALSR